MLASQSCIDLMARPISRKATEIKVGKIGGMYFGPKKIIICIILVAQRCSVTLRNEFRIRTTVGIKIKCWDEGST